MSEKPVVVVYSDENGRINVYSPEDVVVIWVSEASPADRCYRMEPAPVPDGLIDGEIGHKHDGSAAHVRALRARAEMIGERHLSLAPAPPTTPTKAGDAGTPRTAGSRSLPPDQAD